MARPREFDEETVLDAAVLCFWRQGYDATSVRDLCEGTGLTAASLYNAFGDKRALYQRSFDRYVEASVVDRIGRLETRPGREALRAFFHEILERSLGDAEHKGCLMVNAALEPAPGDAEFRQGVVAILGRIETFFRGRVEAGQAEGTITRSLPAASLARHLLGALMGLRVLARARPETVLLESVVSTTLALIEPRPDETRPAR
jgi:TetR/AcrR family transcriptional regulator, transcriptional repressor for nem operon